MTYAERMGIKVEDWCPFIEGTKAVSQVNWTFDKKIVSMYPEYRNVPDEYPGAEHVALWKLKGLKPTQ